MDQTFTAKEMSASQGSTSITEASKTLFGNTQDSARVWDVCTHTEGGDNARYTILAAVLMKIQAFSHVTPSHQHF
jgi:hypothetical protein